jgi:GT2 family glycosyltransferase
MPERTVSVSAHTMRVSVIIPVHDGGGAFRACLAALSASNPRADELIVVVDGPDEEASSIAARAGARVMTLPARVGPALARNLGAAEATGDLLLFVDADVVVPPRLVGHVAARLRDNPGIAAIIGSYDDAPADRGFLSQYRNLLHHYVHQTAHEEASTFWCGCGVIRRQVFLDAGGFNGGFSDPSIEDIEFGYRLRRAGHRIRLARDVQVTHLKRWTPLRLLRTDIFQRAVPWTQLIIRSRVLPNDLNVRWSARGSVALVFLLAASLAAFPWLPLMAGLSLAAVVCLLVLNSGFYGFLWRVRGPGFMLAALPWHWLYYACAGTGFLIGAVQELLGSPASAAPSIGEERSDLQPAAKPSAPCPPRAGGRRSAGPD